MEFVRSDGGVSEGGEHDMRRRLTSGICPNQTPFTSAAVSLTRRLYSGHASSQLSKRVRSRGHSLPNHMPSFPIGPDRETASSAILRNILWPAKFHVESSWCDETRKAVPTRVSYLYPQGLPLNCERKIPKFISMELPCILEHGLS